MTSLIISSRRALYDPGTFAHPATHGGRIRSHRTLSLRCHGHAFGMSLCNVAFRVANHGGSDREETLIDLCPCRRGVPAIVYKAQMTDDYSETMAPLAITSKEFPNEAIKVALAQSLVDGSFTDTAYTLYSRRIGEGKVGAPRRVYACSAVLKAAGQHFRARTSPIFRIISYSMRPATNCYPCRTGRRLHDE